MKLTLTCALAGAAAVIGAGVASAGSADRFRTAIAIDQITPHYFAPTSRAARGDPNGYDFIGHVESTRARCTRGRKITLYRLAPGPDPKLGYDFSDSNGGWSLYLPADEFTGDAHYAKAAKLKLRNGDVCRPDRSPNFTPT
jgi:hypothetical protein